MDRATRKALAWRVSNTLDTAFCIEALEEALVRHGRPGILDTDQGSQFTSPRFTDVLKNADVRISMDGRTRWTDCCNTWRPRSALAGHTPDEAMWGSRNGETGSLTTTGTRLIDTRVLSGETGPPQLMDQGTVGDLMSGRPAPP